MTTAAASGKVKRISHTPRITLTPCDARGRAKPGAPVLEATAVIVDSPETAAALDAALLKKYGMQYRLIRWRSRTRPASIALVITPAE